MEAAKVLIVEDDRDFANTCKKVFNQSGLSAEIAYSGREAIKALNRDKNIEIALVDLKMPEMDGIALLKIIKQEVDDDIDVIIMTGYGTIQSAVHAIKLGAKDYITKPFKKDEIINAVNKILGSKTSKKDHGKVGEEVEQRYTLENIIGMSKKISRTLDMISSASKNDSPVLIVGETGTGKELAAKAIHYTSLRKDGPFVPLNCGAFPRELIESELFGHKKGAFTNALEDKPGLFSFADGGAIFFDEISEMPREVQVKLLRVLQDNRIRPLGELREIPVNARVIAATNQNLEKVLADGSLRKDLYYRISVILIEIPPLRERKEDIPFLVNHFIKKFNSYFHEEVTGLDGDALDILVQHNWPGNVRELENLIEGLFALGISGTIKAEDIVAFVGKKRFRDLSLNHRLFNLTSFQEAEEELIRNALKKTSGNKSEASKILGISRPRLYKKMKLYNFT